MKLKRKFSKSFRLQKQLPFLVLLIVIISGFAIYKTYQASQQDAKQSYAPTVTPTKTFIDAPSPTLIPYRKPTEYAPQKAVVENGYAIIPELEIKFKVGEGLNDLIYTAVSFDDQNYQNYKSAYARFTTQTLLNLDSGCNTSSNAIGSIGKSLDDPREKVSGIKNVKKIGDYYYVLGGIQALCSGKDNANALQNKQLKLLYDAFQTIEVIQ